MSSPTADGSALSIGAMTPVGPSAADIQRRRLLLLRWRRRSAVIMVLRRVLPALCVLLLLALAGTTLFNTFFSRLGGGAPETLAIRLLKPNFRGRNDEGKPYLITADSAVRDDADPNKVALQKPVFVLGEDPAQQTHVRSLHGIYRDDTRILDLTGDVHLDDAGGYHFVSEHALVDTRSNNVDGDKAVQGHGPLGRIASSAYAVRNGGAHVFFTGHVKSHIENRGVTAAGLHSSAPGGAAPAAKQGVAEGQ